MHFVPGIVLSDRMTNEASYTSLRPLLYYTHHIWVLGNFGLIVFSQIKTKFSSIAVAMVPNILTQI